MSSDANATSTSSARISARLHKPAASRRRRYLKAGLLLLFALIAGIAIGVSSTLMYFKNKFPRKRPTTEEVAQGILERMEKSVALTPDEHDKIAGIIKFHMNEVDRVRKESFNVLFDEMDKMSDNIAEILGPERNDVWEADKDKHFGEERKKYHRRKQRHKEELDNDKKSPPPPPFGGP